ncbi:MAG: DUF2304 domain-containing protein [Methanosphaera sp.]|nr:DUF2304 domain-containing protein [Methanosphaera sp.]
MLTYQIILLLLSIIGIALGIYRYRNESFSNSVFALWTFVWIIIIIVTLFPSITTHFANLFGIGRGLDSVYIVSILFLFYIVFKLYNKIEQQKKRINELVSQLTLKENEE